MYGIVCNFRNDSGVWGEKGYTFKSDLPYLPGDLVLSEVKDWYGVVKVVKCTPKYAFNPTLNYKKILCIVPLSK